MAEAGDHILRAVDELQQHYIAALDRGDMAGWLATFASRPDAGYACIAAENEQRGFGLALMLDDCRARLEDRVTVVTQVWAGTFQAYRTRHFVQRIGCVAETQALFQVTSNFSIMMTPDGGSSSVLAVGAYHDRILFADGMVHFLEKRAVYDTTVLPRYVVYPF